MRKILVVDDSSLALEQMARVLEHRSVRLMMARSAREALEVHEQERMDMMFVDLHMPEVDGTELCRALRTNAGLRSVSIVMVSASSTEADRVRSLEAGANAYLPKPLTRAAVLRTLLKFLNVAPRKKVEVLVQMQLLATPQAEPFDARTLNLSTSGMLAQTIHPVEVGAAVMCHFALPSVPAPLVFTAEVVRSAQGPTRGTNALGVRFLRTDSTGLTALERFVAGG